MNPKNQDVRDAQTLASYLARNGVQGVEAEIATVTQLACPTEDGPPPDLPEQFYEHYQKLALKAAPVTVASLQASLSKFGRLPFRIVNVLAMGTALVAVGVLFFLGHLHCDWLTMTDLT